MNPGRIDPDPDLDPSLKKTDQDRTVNQPGSIILYAQEVLTYFIYELNVENRQRLLGQAVYHHEIHIFARSLTNRTWL